MDFKLERTATVLTATLFFFSCTYNTTYPTLPGNDGIKDSICYEKEVQPILSSNCAKSGCHNSGHGGGEDARYDFSNYLGTIKAVVPGNPQASPLYRAISGNAEHSMPPAPNPPLTSLQIQTIHDWIFQGALLGVDCAVTIACDTSDVTYSLTIQPILQNNCLGCHSNPTTGGGIILSDYNSVLAQVVNGKLWGAINGLPGYVPMPLNGTPLDDCQINQISIWIKSGSPNN